MYISSDCLDNTEPLRYENAGKFKFAGADKEKRSGAKDYASMYRTYDPRPGWYIADQ
jgi:hypothetical protein